MNIKMVNVSWIIDPNGRLLIFSGLNEELIKGYPTKTPDIVITEEAAQNEWFKAQGYEERGGYYFLCDEAGYIDQNGNKEVLN